MRSTLSQSGSRASIVAGGFALGRDGLVNDRMLLRRLLSEKSILRII